MRKATCRGCWPSTRVAKHTHTVAVAFLSAILVCGDAPMQAGRCHRQQQAVTATTSARLCLVMFLWRWCLSYCSSWTPYRWRQQHAYAGANWLFCTHTYLCIVCVAHSGPVPCRTPEGVCGSHTPLTSFGLCSSCVWLHSHQRQLQCRCTLVECGCTAWKDSCQHSSCQHGALCLLQVLAPAGHL
jgi:hypothetical protein